MNDLVVNVIIILFPGIIGTIIVDKVAVHSKWGSFKFGLYAIVMGILSYGSLQLVYWLIDIYSNGFSFSNVQWTHLTTWYAVLNHELYPKASEILFASILSVPTAFLMALTVNLKLINHCAQFIKVTTKYGDENLYSYYLNLKEIEWIYLRDIDNNLSYRGRLISYA